MGTERNANARRLMRMAVWFGTLFASAGLMGCRDKGPGAAAALPEVTVITAQRDPVPVTTELPGRTSAYLVAQVRARVDGIVQKREFQEGSNVDANQRLYQIDPAPYRAILESAQASLARARANLESTRAQAERDKVLVAANAISEQKYINESRHKVRRPRTLPRDSQPCERRVSTSVTRT
jgi:membrane fusion protein (multidrug efflux system)